MAIKSFQGKLMCDSPSQRDYLISTHRVFNDYVARVLPIVYAAYRGRHGPDVREILRSIDSAQSAKNQLEAITSLTSRPGAGPEGSWKNIARRLLSEGRILFDRNELLPGVGSEFRRKVFEMCFQIILGHVEKRKQWRLEHDEWLKERDSFHQENADYFQVRPVINEFQLADGQAGKRRGRWHRWLAFLAEHPQLAAWRGQPAIVNPLSAGELAAAMADRRRGIKKAFELFWERNPELAALDRLHGAYERTYIRPWAKRCHVDRFKVPPSFTIPSAVGHPAWYQFKKGETYQHLALERGTIELKVVRDESAAAGSSQGFVRYRFISDPRLSEFSPALEPVKVGREVCDLVYHGNSALGPRPAAIKGVKLIFREEQPYLYFSSFVADIPSRITLTQASFDKYGGVWAGKTVQKALGGSLRTMALDLGIRHIAVATIMESEILLATRFIHNRPRSYSTGQTIDGIPSLEQIAAMKKQLRRQLQRRGKPSRNQVACATLRAHIRRMSEDRFKKCAAAIVDLARHHLVDVVVLEKLTGLIPDAERERGINRALVNWNRGQLVAFLKKLCPEQGLRVAEVPPYWTSQVCSRCNKIGQRYSLRDGKIEYGMVEKLFGCPSCGYRCNADFNASANLHRVFLGTFPQVSSAGKGKCTASGELVVFAEVQQRLAQQLETPF